MRAIQNDLMGDYDNEPGLKLLALNKKTLFFNNQYTLWFHEGCKDGREIEFEGRVITTEEAEKLIIDSIESTIKDFSELK